MRDNIYFLGKVLVVFLCALIVLISCENGLMDELKQQVDSNYKLLYFNLDIHTSSGGSVSPEGTIEIRSGTSFEITATPDSGMLFVRWEKTGGSGVVSFGDMNSAATTVSISEGDAAIRAVFGGNLLSLTVTAAAGGTITSPVSSPVNVEEGVGISISASANTGYEFDGWSKTSGTGAVSFGNSSLASTTVSVTGGDASIQASFVLKTYSLYTSVNNGTLGDVTNPTTSPVSVTHGVARNISASWPQERGYYFSGWSKTGGSGTAVFADSSRRFTTVTVTNADVTIQANFSPISVSLTYRGSYDLNGSPYSARRIDTPKDLVYDNGYIYVLGNYFSSPKVLKLDVSNPVNPSYAADNNYLAGGTAEEICVNGSNLDMTVSGTGGGINRIPLSNFGETDPLYHSDSFVRNITQGYYESDDEIYKYFVQDPIQPDTNIFDILYSAEYGYLYASGTDDMGVQGSLSVISGTNPLSLVGSTIRFEEYINELAYIGDIYMYGAAKVDGIVTFNIDNSPVSKQSVQGATANTGNPEHIDLDGSDFLFVSGDNSSGYDRLSVFDIHWWNGSNGNPYYLYSRASYRDANVTAVEYVNGYLYTLEGSWLVIYEFSSNSD